MRALPVGVPKLMVSTLASGDTRPYVGAVDVTMMYSVVDISGVNRVSARIMTNAAGAIAGMAQATVPASRGEAARRGDDVRRHDAVRDPTPASASRSSGTRCSCSMPPARAASRWRRWRAGGFLAGVLDVTTTELADELVGGVLSAGPDRLEAAGRRGLPQVVSLGALDMVNFGPRETVPPQFEGRNLYVHNPTVTLMRTTPDECAELGRPIGRKLSARDRADRAVHPARRRLDDRRRRDSRSTTPRPTRHSRRAARDARATRSRCTSGARRSTIRPSPPRWPTGCTS